MKRQQSRFVWSSLALVLGLMMAAPAVAQKTGVARGGKKEAKTSQAMNQKASGKKEAKSKSGKKQNKSGKHQEMIADKSTKGPEAKGESKEHGKAGQAHGKSGTGNGKAGEDHGKAGEDHGKAGEDHGKAGEDHGKAGGDHGKSGELRDKATPRGKCHLKKEWRKHLKRIAKIERIRSLAKDGKKADLEAVAQRIEEKEMKRHRRAVLRCQVVRPANIGSAAKADNPVKADVDKAQKPARAKQVKKMKQKAKKMGDQ